MAKKHKRQHRRSRAKPGPKKYLKWLKQVRGTLLSPSGIFWTSVSLVIGGVGFYFQMKPKLSVEADAPIAFEDVINIPFRITNESLLPVYRVRQEWEIDEMKTRNVLFTKGLFKASRVPDIAILEAGKITTAYPLPNLAIPQELERVSMTVIIKYETAIFHFRRSERFGFETRDGPNGELHWYHKG